MSVRDGNSRAALITLRGDNSMMLNGRLRLRTHITFIFSEFKEEKKRGAEIKAMLTCIVRLSLTVWEIISNNKQSQTLI